MKEIFEFWWSKHTKCFQITSFKKVWKENGVKPLFRLHHNGAKRSKGDVCFDIELIVGYVVFNYTNFDLQKRRKRKNERQSFKRH